MRNLAAIPNKIITLTLAVSNDTTRPGPALLRLRADAIEAVLSNASQIITGTGTYCTVVYTNQHTYWVRESAEDVIGMIGWCGVPSCRLSNKIRRNK